MLKALYTIYYWLIAVPLFVLSTILFSLLTMVGCFFFGKGVFAYYPGKWWSMVACALFGKSVRKRESARKEYAFSDYGKPSGRDGYLYDLRPYR